MRRTRYDVFIAYHGSFAANGSVESARAIYKHLTGLGFRCFFFPESSRTGNYKANVKEILESRCFLLVCNSNIEVEADGSLSVREHLNLFAEIDTFWGLTQIGDAQINDSAVVAVGADFHKGNEALFHPIFCDRIAMYGDEMNTCLLDRIGAWAIDRKKEAEELMSGLSFEIEAVYANRTFIKPEHIRQAIAGANKIVAIGIGNGDLSGYSLMDALRRFLQGGGELEIYYLDPESEIIFQRAVDEGFSRRDRISCLSKNQINTMLDLCKEIPNAHVNLYVYALPPRMNAIMIGDLTFLQFYSYGDMGVGNPVFVLRRQKDTSPLCDFVSHMYEYIKSRATRREEYYE